MSNSIVFQKQKPPVDRPVPVGPSHQIAVDIIETVESAIWKTDSRTSGGKTFPVEVSVGTYFPTRDFFTVFVESEYKLTCREVRAAAKEVLYHFMQVCPLVRVYATYYSKRSTNSKYLVNIDIDFHDHLETINSTLDFWVSTPKIEARGSFESTTDLYSRYCSFALKKYDTGIGKVRLASKGDFVSTLKNAGVLADENKISHWIIGDLETQQS